MATKVFEVKRKLADWGKGVSAIMADQIDVTYGFNSRTSERTAVVIGDVEWSESRFVTTGHRRQEVLSIDVLFAVRLPASDSEEVEGYVLRLAAGFEDQLQADPSIGGLAILSDFHPVRLRSWPEDEGRTVAIYETEVTVTCRL